MTPMLFARSPDECHLYMELHPCTCGSDVFTWTRHSLEQRDAQLVSVYEGACGRCDTGRRFEFEVAGGVREPQGEASRAGLAVDQPAPPAYGGAAPSLIIDPGEFLASSQQAAAEVPADPARVDADQLGEAYDAIDVAVAGIVEVLKFIPDGADAVPEAAFTSALGRRMYAGDPPRFRRARLALELAELERIRSAYASALDE
jgi:hypothetical protein